MRYRFYFCSRADQRLIDFLNKNNISHKVSGEGTYLPLATFNLYSTAEHTEHYLNELKKMNLEPNVTYPEYTPKEMNRAELIWLWPKRQHIEIINESEAFKPLCTWKSMFNVPFANHEEQQGLVAISKEPSMKTSTAMWCEDTGFSLLFADYRVRNLVVENALKGVDFQKVMLPKNRCSERLFQMASPYVLGGDCIGRGYGEKTELCEMCGRESIQIGHAYQLHLDFTKLNAISDFYVTKPIFGPGIDHSLYIISQRFYQLLKSHKLTGGVRFSPVIDIK